MNGEGEQLVILVEQLVIAGVCSLVAAGAGALFFRMEIGAAQSTTWLMGRALSSQGAVAKAHRVRTRAWLRASVAWACAAFASSLPATWMAHSRKNQIVVADYNKSLVDSSGGAFWCFIFVVPAFVAAVVTSFHGSYAIPRTCFKAPAATAWAIVWSALGLTVLCFLLWVEQIVAYLAAGGHM